jgi:hypothetical protein
MAHRIIKEAGLTWADVVTSTTSSQRSQQSQQSQQSYDYADAAYNWEPDPPPEPVWHKFCHEIIDSGRATEWEVILCYSMLNRWDKDRLSQKQKDVFERIYNDRVFKYRKTKAHV